MVASCGRVLKVGYGKVNTDDEELHDQPSRKLWCCGYGCGCGCGYGALLVCSSSIAITLLLLLVLLLFSPSNHRPSSPSDLFALCSSTSFPALCLDTLSSAPPSSPLPDLTAIFASVALLRLNRTYSLALNLSHSPASHMEIAVLQDCLELMDGSRDELSLSIARLTTLDLHSPTFHAQVSDVQAWLSASYTDQDTCSDEFQDMSGHIKDQMIEQGDAICNLLSIALEFAQTLQHSGHSSSRAYAPVLAPIAS